jgi:Flp pilus assembly pilin Flp
MNRGAPPGKAARLTFTALQGSFTKERDMKMKHFCQQANRFWQDETGLELSEYAVATALISIAVAGAFTSLGQKIKDAMNNLESKIVTS